MVSYVWCRYRFISLFIQVQKTNPITEVNRVSGEKGNQWFQLNTDIGVQLQNKEWVRIIVEAVVGAGFSGDIAIDDTAWLANVTCGSSQTTTTTITPVTPTTYRKFKLL